MKTGIELITEERLEQIEKHGRDLLTDFIYNKDRQLTQAASILISAHLHNITDEDKIFLCPIGWCKEIWIKMFNKPYEERVKIAGALCAAELDRINYNL